MSKCVFISYSRSDGNDFAEKLEAALQMKSYATWRDTRGIDPSQDFTSEIEIAIRKSTHIIACITPDTVRNNSFVRREIQYALLLGKPVIVARFERETLPPIHIINNTWLEFYRDWESAFSMLCNYIEEMVQQKTGIPGQTDPFHDYLIGLYEDVVDYLDSTVVSLIQLHSKLSDPISAPSRQKRTLASSFRGSVLQSKRGLHSDYKQVFFEDFVEAFNYFNGRVLLLGTPGAGKTTTIFALARDAIARRLEDDNAPLPILVRISDWSAYVTVGLAQWLGIIIPSLSNQQISEVIAQGRGLLLLDGLDELSSDYKITKSIKERPDAISQRMANESGGTEVKITNLVDARRAFIDILPTNNRIVVSCRKKDFQELGKEIMLDGAVELLDVDSKQLSEYLKGQPQLLDLIQADPGLQEIVKTPLLLGILLYIYQHSQTSLLHVQKLHETTGHLRSILFNAYIQKRFDHERARRNAKIVYDEAATYRVLQQIAVDNALNDRISQNQLAIIDFQKLLGKKTDAFLEQMYRLHILATSGKAHVRFLHSLMRDYFAVPELLLMVQDVPRNPAAIDALVRLSDDRAVVAFITALKDEDYFIRERAARALSKLSDSSMVQPLVFALHDEDSHVRLNVRAALAQTKGACVPAMISLIQRNEDINLVREAVQVLIIVGAEAVDSIILTIDDERSGKQALYHFVHVLASIGDNRAIKFLSRLLSDETPVYWEERLCDAAVAALENIGTKEAQALIDQWYLHKP